MAIVNSLRGIVWEADPGTFHFSFVSPHAETVLGYPTQQWLNEPDFWRAHTHPDDVGWCASFCSNAVEKGEDHDFEYRMILFTEKNGGAWSYTYEYTSATVKTATDPYNNTTSYTHDANGQMLSKTDPGGGTTWYTYDTLGNVTSVQDPLGNITNNTYNAFGQILTSSGPQGTRPNRCEKSDHKLQL